MVVVFVDFISDNEGSIINPRDYQSGLESDPGPSDNRLQASSEQRQSRCISQGSSLPFTFVPMLDDKLIGPGGKPTIHFNNCIIARAFLKERPSEGLIGSLIGRALLAHSDALCAAATPMMNNVLDV